LRTLMVASMNPATDRTRHRHCASAVMAMPLANACGGAQIWHPCESAQTPEITFRALLTQDGTQQLEMVRT
jgi:hypothetical protein